jgi:glutamyl-tRNA synthetase
LNSIYIKSKSSDDILCLIEKDVDSLFEEKLRLFKREQVLKLIELFKERVKTLKDFIDEINALDRFPVTYDLSMIDFAKGNFIKNFEQIINELQNISIWNEDQISFSIKTFCKQNNIKITQPIRVALTGLNSSPGVFSLLMVLGKNESLSRLNAFLDLSKGEIRV